MNMSQNQDLQLLGTLGSDNSWLNAKYEELQEEHPNEYVAVSGKKVIGCGKTIENLIDELKSKKINLSIVLIEFVPEKGLKIIL